VIKLDSTLSNITTINMDVSGDPANVSLLWANFSYTKLSANKTYWENFQGTDSILISLERTADETKSRDFILNFTSTTSGVNSTEAMLSSAIVKHPLALFMDISETPGYSYNLSGTPPYTSWTNSLVGYTDSFHLPFDFYNYEGNEDGKDWRAYDLALTYQITGNATYAEKVMEALDCISTDPENYTLDVPDRFMSNSLLKYSLAYDWTAEYLIEKNETLYYKVRDRLANLSNQIYFGIPERTNAHAKTDMASDLGVASIVLEDYDSDYATTPDDWFNAATDWLFIEDSVNNRAILEYYNNPAGLSELGDYKSYWIEHVLLWANVYNYKYQNVSNYQILRNVINEVTWLPLPGGTWDSSYSRMSVPGQNTRNNFMSSDCDYSFYALNILPQTESEYHRWVIDKYLDEDDPSDSGIRYFAFLVYDKFSTTPQQPNFKTKISEEGEMAIFRNGWENESDYLFLKAMHYPVDSNRGMTHHDSMSFDYYSKGDYLLIDSGEVKDRKPGYGPVDAMGHNTIMISDGMSSNPGGPNKGTASFTIFKNPAHIISSLTSDTFEFAKAEIANWNSIEDTFDTGEQDGTSTIDLSAPVKWQRTILYPSFDYFLVLDYISNSQLRMVNNLFHLGSLSHTEGNATYNGTVNGDLTIEDGTVNWIGQEFNNEISITQGNKVEWETTNIENEPLELQLFSTPISDITVQKFWARIGLGGLGDEIDHPIIRYKINTSAPLFRITALSSRYTSEAAKSIEEISVSGNGNAMRITSTGYEDYVCIGDSSSKTFSNIVTDANIAFSRYKTGTGLEYFFISNGTSFSYKGNDKLSASIRPDYAIVSFNGTKIELRINGSGSGTITMKDLNAAKVYAVKRDGIAYSNWEMQNSNKDIAITTSLSEHTFEIYVTGDRDGQEPGDNGDSPPSSGSSPYTPLICTESWECDAWTACQLGSKTRSCDDKNNCGTSETKPREIASCCEKLDIAFFPIEVRINNGTRTNFIISAEINCDPDTIELYLQGIEEDWYSVEKIIESETPGIIEFNVTMDIPDDADEGKIYLSYQPVSTLMAGAEYNSILQVVTPKTEKKQVEGQEQAGEELLIALEIMLAIILTVAILFLVRLYRTL
jgi:hypothetical protein